MAQLLTKIFGGVIIGFMQPDRMEVNARVAFDRYFELIKDSNAQQLRGRHFAPHKIDIQVEIFMVELFDHLILYDYFKVLQVNQITGYFTKLALDGDKQGIVVSMPIGIGTFTKYGFIFFGTPVLPVHPVRSIEGFPARHINNHRYLFTLGKAGYTARLS